MRFSLLEAKSPGGANIITRKGASKDKGTDHKGDKPVLGNETWSLITLRLFSLRNQKE